MFFFALAMTKGEDTCSRRLSFLAEQDELLRNSMDNAFLLDDSARSNFLHATMNSFGCTYICLWIYSTPPHYVTPPFSRLQCLDGLYHEEDNSQPSSSSGTLAQRLFYDYRQSLINLDNDMIPGLAFKNNYSFLEVNESDLQILASVDVQRRFYMAARIKTSFFFGSIHGEIELGFTNIFQVNKAMEVINILFPDARRLNPSAEPLQPIMDQTPLSSSPSSLRSQSMSSPDCSSFTFSVPTTSFLPTQAFPSAISILTALPSSSPPPPPSGHHSSRNLHEPSLPNPKDGAFRRYSSASRSAVMNQSSVRQSMLKRSISFLGQLNFRRILDQRTQPSLPTSVQLQHMISERKRREKLKESFQALRSLLPAGTKRDKTSVLATTRETLISLKAQVEDLRRKNQLLETQILPKQEPKEETTRPSSNERVIIRVAPLPESSSSSSSSPKGKVIDLEIVVKEALPIEDITKCVLEFLKQINSLTIVSIEANAREFNLLNTRLIIEDCDWDEAAFEEALRRLVADLITKK